MIFTTQKSALSHISDVDLAIDLEESYYDVAVCNFALRNGVTHHADGFSVAERLKINLAIIAKIRAEQKWRVCSEKNDGRQDLQQVQGALSRASVGGIAYPYGWRGRGRRIIK